MSLDQIIEQVRADTEAEVGRIRAEAEAKAGAVAGEAAARGEALFRRELEALGAQLGFAALRERATREIEIRRSLLQERELLLDEVRKRFERHLAGLPPAEEKALLAGLLACARRVLPEGVPVVSRRGRELLGADAAGAEIDESVAGLRWRSADGRRVVDLTLDSLARGFWSERRVAVAGELFGAAAEIGESGG